MDRLISLLLSLNTAIASADAQTTKMDDLTAEGDASLCQVVD
ncbi:MAG: hypothetical protein QNJ22_23915 [Desulfosarcinaceae bacterium]|nr:hypothetical protein [Desulfosarcinaceae bacterium]